MGVLSVYIVPGLLLACGAASVFAGEPAELERSYWLHASLGVSMVKGYWAPEAPVGPDPTSQEVGNAARLLTGHYGANRLYLIYHNEISAAGYLRLLRVWRAACGREVDIVPTLVLRMYNPEQTPVFTDAELARLCRALKGELSLKSVAVYDVMPGRDQGSGLALLAREFPLNLLRVGIQPDEEIASPYVAAVQDTWSGLCAGKTHEDWILPGFGAQTLRKWVRDRNAQRKPVAWDLVVVAWDYSVTKHGEFPGYDDAARNMPLPSGRNTRAAEIVRNEASKTVLRGFSSDLLIVEANSRHEKRDGPRNSLYTALRAGRPYGGYFAEPLEEIAAIYRSMSSRLPSK